MILEVAVEVNGTKYVGSYTVKEGIISVTCPTYGGKTARVEEQPARILARELLEEIIRGAMARGEVVYGASTEVSNDEREIEEL